MHLGPEEERSALYGQPEFLLVNQSIKNILFQQDDINNMNNIRNAVGCKNKAGESR